jgi:UDP-N-acetylmuramyl pentapeptide synthase
MKYFTSLQKVWEIFSSPGWYYHLYEKTRKILDPILYQITRIYRITLGKKVYVISVIGSLGKTTTTKTIAAVLGVSLKQPTNYNFGIGISWGFLKSMLKEKETVIEAGIGAKKQMCKHASLIRPDMVVVTSIASEHLHSFESIEEIRDEKADMLRALTSESVVILNGDDQNVLWMKNTTRAKMVTYGFNDSNDILADCYKIEKSLTTSFTLHTKEFERKVNIKLLGKKYVYSALASVAVGLERGVDIDKIIERLEKVEPVIGRLQLVRLDNRAVIIRDDFKSALETAVTALDLLENIPARRKILILGHLDHVVNRYQVVYKEMGRRIGEVVDRAIFYSEGTSSFVKGALQGGLSKEEIFKVNHDWKDVLKVLPSDLGEGDVVLIKGRTNQRMGRIALALCGMEITCNRKTCDLSSNMDCSECRLRN